MSKHSFLKTVALTLVITFTFTNSVGYSDLPSSFSTALKNSEVYHMRETAEFNGGLVNVRSELRKAGIELPARLEIPEDDFVSAAGRKPQAERLKPVAGSLKLETKESRSELRGEVNPETEALISLILQAGTWYAAFKGAQWIRHHGFGDRLEAGTREEESLLQYARFRNLASALFGEYQKTENKIPLQDIDKLLSQIIENGEETYTRYRPWIERVDSNYLFGLRDIQKHIKKILSGSQQDWRFPRTKVIDGTLWNIGSDLASLDISEELNKALPVIMESFIASGAESVTRKPFPAGFKFNPRHDTYSIKRTSKPNVFAFEGFGIFRDRPDKKFVDETIMLFNDETSLSRSARGAVEIPFDELSAITKPIEFPDPNNTFWSGWGLRLSDSEQAKIKNLRDALDVIVKLMGEHRRYRVAVDLDSIGKSGLSILVHAEKSPGSNFFDIRDHIKGRTAAEIAEGLREKLKVDVKLMNGNALQFPMLAGLERVALADSEQFLKAVTALEILRSELRQEQDIQALTQKLQESQSVVESAKRALDMAQRSGDADAEKLRSLQERVRIASARLRAIQQDLAQARARGRSELRSIFEQKDGELPQVLDSILAMITRWIPEDRPSIRVQQKIAKQTAVEKLADQIAAQYEAEPGKRLNVAVMASEPFVPDQDVAFQIHQRLKEKLGRNVVGWGYEPDAFRPYDTGATRPPVTVRVLAPGKAASTKGAFKVFVSYDFRFVLNSIAVTSKEVIDILFGELVDGFKSSRKINISAEEVPAWFLAPFLLFTQPVSYLYYVTFGFSKQDQNIRLVKPDVILKAPLEKPRSELRSSEEKSHSFGDKIANAVVAVIVAGIPAVAFGYLTVEGLNKLAAHPYLAWGVGLVVAALTTYAVIVNLRQEERNLDQADEEIAGRSELRNANQRISWSHRPIRIVAFGFVSAIAVISEAGRHELSRSAADFNGAMLTAFSLAVGGVVLAGAYGSIKIFFSRRSELRAGGSEILFFSLAAATLYGLLRYADRNDAQNYLLDWAKSQNGELQFKAQKLIAFNKKLGKSGYRINKAFQSLADDRQKAKFVEEIYYAYVTSLFFVNDRPVTKDVRGIESVVEEIKRNLDGNWTVSLARKSYLRDGGQHKHPVPYYNFEVITRSELRAKSELRSFGFFEGKVPVTVEVYTDHAGKLFLKVRSVGKVGDYDREIDIPVDSGDPAGNARNVALRLTQEGYSAHVFGTVPNNSTFIEFGIRANPASDLSQNFFYPDFAREKGGVDQAAADLQTLLNFQLFAPKIGVPVIFDIKSLKQLSFSPDFQTLTVKSSDGKTEKEHTRSKLPSPSTTSRAAPASRLDDAKSELRQRSYNAFSDMSRQGRIAHALALGLFSGGMVGSLSVPILGMGYGIESTPLSVGIGIGAGVITAVVTYLWTGRKRKTEPFSVPDRRSTGNRSELRTLDPEDAFPADDDVARTQPKQADFKVDRVLTNIGNQEAVWSETFSLHASGDQKFISQLGTYDIVNNFVDELKGHGVEVFMMNVRRITRVSDIPSLMKSGLPISLSKEPLDKDLFHNNKRFPMNLADDPMTVLILLKGPEQFITKVVGHAIAKDMKTFMHENGASRRHSGLFLAQNRVNLAIHEMYDEIIKLSGIHVDNQTIPAFIDTLTEEAVSQAIARQTDSKVKIEVTDEQLRAGIRNFNDSLAATHQLEPTDESLAADLPTAKSELRATTGDVIELGKQLERSREALQSAEQALAEEKSKTNSDASKISELTAKHQTASDLFEKLNKQMNEARLSAKSELRSDAGQAADVDAQKIVLNAILSQLSPLEPKAEELRGKSIDFRDQAEKLELVVTEAVNVAAKLYDLSKQLETINAPGLQPLVRSSKARIAELLRKLESANLIQQPSKPADTDVAGQQGLLSGILSQLNALEPRAETLRQRLIDLRDAPETLEIAKAEAAAVVLSLHTLATQLETINAPGLQPLVRSSKTRVEQSLTKLASGNLPADGASIVRSELRRDDVGRIYQAAESLVANAFDLLQSRASNDNASVDEKTVSNDWLSELVKLKTVIQNLTAAPDHNQISRVKFLSTKLTRSARILRNELIATHNNHISDVPAAKHLRTIQESLTDVADRILHFLDTEAEIKPSQSGAFAADLDRIAGRLKPKDESLKLETGSLKPDPKSELRASRFNDAEFDDLTADMLAPHETTLLIDTMEDGMAKLQSPKTVDAKLPAVAKLLNAFKRNESGKVLGSIVTQELIFSGKTPEEKQALLYALSVIVTKTQDPIAIVADSAGEIAIRTALKGISMEHVVIVEGYPEAISSLIDLNAKEFRIIASDTEKVYFESEAAERLKIQDIVYISRDDVGAFFRAFGIDQVVQDLTVELNERLAALRSA